ncbi:MAG: hypothetical protein Q9208_005451 [Pyrenodesmia sp. 3 TL-2023]
MPGMKGSGMKWDAAADASLFKCVLKVHDVKPNYGELAKEMKELGYDCTPKALTHRIGNIRKSTGGPTDASASDAGGGTPANNTPVKNAKPAKATKAKPAPKNAPKKTSANGSFTGGKGGNNGKRKHAEMNHPTVTADEESLASGNDDDQTVKGEGSEIEESEEKAHKGKKVKVEDVDDEEV